MRAGAALPLGASIRQYCSRLWYPACLELVPNALSEIDERSQLAVLQEARMAENETEAYLVV